MLESIKYDGRILTLIDQRVLPGKKEWITYERGEPVVEAISDMVVRGAPAIGVAAAYAVVLEARALVEEGEKADALGLFIETLKRARPTAVNLMWAAERMRGVLQKERPLAEQIQDLEKEAIKIHREDKATNEAMARAGLSVIRKGDRILTHCNTGALATSHLGTAFGVIFKAKETYGDIFVLADETRPRLQGARLTAFELKEAGIDFKLQADGAAAHAMKTGQVDIVLVGADRIAANGDTANKIGTLMLAVLCHHYHIPFYVVAPTSTVDLSTHTGRDIEIEERSPNEVFYIDDCRVAPEGIQASNPAFDVTDHQLITGIITEKGVLRPPFYESLKKALR